VNFLIAATKVKEQGLVESTRKRSKLTEVVGMVSVLTKSVEGFFAEEDTVTPCTGRSHQGKICSKRRENAPVTHENAHERSAEKYQRRS